MTDRKAKQTPLPDLLDRVPEDIVLGIPGNEPVFPSYTNIPIGRLARDAAAELRRLHTDAEESEALRERLSELLRNTAIALRGPEPELTRWSWHDLPELAAALKAQRDALLEACKTLVNLPGTEDWIATLRLAVEQARAAIKAVEGENHAKNL